MQRNADDMGMPPFGVQESIPPSSPAFEAAEVRWAYPRLDELPPNFPEVGTIWEHLARGSFYRISGPGVIEATFEIAVGYEAVERAPVTLDHWQWQHYGGAQRVPIYRPLREFLDGRFRRVD